MQFHPYVILHISIPTGIYPHTYRDQISGLTSSWHQVNTEYGTESMWREHQVPPDGFGRQHGSSRRTYKEASNNLPTPPHCIHHCNSESSKPTNPPTPGIDRMGPAPGIGRINRWSVGARGSILVPHMLGFFGLYVPLS